MRLSFHANESAHAFVKWIKSGILKAHYKIHILEHSNAFESTRAPATRKAQQWKTGIYRKILYVIGWKGFFSNAVHCKSGHQNRLHLIWNEYKKKCPIYCFCVCGCVSVRANQKSTRYKSDQYCVAIDGNGLYQIWSVNCVLIQ